jgi:hypothetical protein
VSGTLPGADVRGFNRVLAIELPGSRAGRRTSSRPAQSCAARRPHGDTSPEALEPQRRMSSQHTCQGCSAPLPPPLRTGRSRKWCSDACRKRTLYAGRCVDCGAGLSGSEGRGPAHRNAATRARLRLRLRARASAQRRGVR